jgi:hypothetical protein
MTILFLSIGCGGGSGDPGLALNEVAGGGSGPFWLELASTSVNPMDIGGWVLASSAGGELVLASRTIAPGEVVLIDPAQLGFAAAPGEVVSLLAPGRTSVVDGVEVAGVPQARVVPGRGSWVYPDTTSPGSANKVVLGNDVIINEIMYHHAPQAVPGAVPASDGEEWIELYNRGSATVDLAGWELVDAVAYTIPAGIALPAGGYLVVARKSAKLRALYPAMAIIGDFVGRLDNTSGNIVLRNACGNPVDSVRYFDGGRWPSRPDVGGSSLELRDPSADNSAAEAWAASDESAAAVWQTFSYQGELFASGDLQKLVGPPARRRAFYGHLLDIIRTSYNEAYMGRWCQHYGALLSGQDFTGHCQFIADRSRWRWKVPLIRWYLPCQRSLSGSLPTGVLTSRLRPPTFFLRAMGGWTSMRSCVTGTPCRQVSRGPVCRPGWLPSRLLAVLT